MKSQDLNNNRLGWDDYFFEIANSVSKRATCDRGKSGCVIVKNRQILVTGFVGPPSGFAHCDDVGHQIKRLTQGKPSDSEGTGNLFQKGKKETVARFLSLGVHLWARSNHAKVFSSS